MPAPLPDLTASSHGWLDSRISLLVNLTVITGVHQVLDGEDLVQFFSVQEAHLQDNFADRAAGSRAFATDQDTVVVPDPLVQVGHDPDRVHDVVPANFLVHRDSVDAELAQRLR